MLDDLTQIVPQGLLKRIKAHFAEGVAEAVNRYRFNAADEDSLTGALGQALSTPETLVTVTEAGRYSFAVESYKILGKGPGAPESRLGADGIFQVIVWQDDHRIFEKGLPFQAKKSERYRQAEVLEQARDMYHTSGSGIILRYGPEAYEAADVRHLVSAHQVMAVPTPQGFAPLGSVLGDWFLKCQVGRIGLAFDRDAPDPLMPGKYGTWVISTRIHKTTDKLRNG